ncbi:MAG: 4'-phosphopantetheinyl transferase superfamily protein, partial [Silvanigrellaceae bacterium]|nr:4'-phosphopantetheinyl transferase superfamily protein [Silvanigrellaceae bacterium]
MHIQIGTDIVSVRIFEKSLLSEKFIERVFHAEEIKYCNEKVNKLPSFAARFAAKEAFAKALGTGLFIEKVYPKNVWVQNDL